MTIAKNMTCPLYLVPDSDNSLVSPEDKVATLVYVCLQLVLMAFILSANGLVVFAMVKYVKRRNNETYTLIKNLVAADIFMGLVLPLQAVSRLGVLPLSEDYLCFLRLSTLTMASFASLFSVLLTAIDRYIGVCKCTRYPALVNKFRVMIAILVVWVYSFVIAVYPVHYFATDSAIKVIANECVYVGTVTRGYSLFIPIQYFLLLCVMCILYSRIYKVALRRGRLISCESLYSSRAWRLRRELRAAKFMAVVLIVYICCWTPHAVFELYTSLTSDVNVLVARFGNASLLLGILSSAINPIIYPCQNRVFRDALQNVMNMRLCSVS